MFTSFRVRFHKTTTSGFTAGQLVSDNDYRIVGPFKGCDEIREGKSKKYLAIAGQVNVSGGRTFGHHVYEILDAPQGLDISGKNAVANAVQPFGENEGMVYFSNDYNELPLV